MFNEILPYLFIAIIIALIPFKPTYISFQQPNKRERSLGMLPLWKAIVCCSSSVCANLDCHIVPFWKVHYVKED